MVFLPRTLVRVVSYSMTYLFQYEGVTSVDQGSIEELLKSELALLTERFPLPFPLSFVLFRSLMRYTK